MQSETAGDTVCDVKDEPFANTLAIRLAQVKASQVAKTLTNVNCALLLLTLALMLVKVEAQRIAKTLKDV